MGILFWIAVRFGIVIAGRFLFPPLRHRLDHPGLNRRQEVQEQGTIDAGNISRGQQRRIIEPNDPAHRRDPDLTGATLSQIPNQVPLRRFRCVIVVRAPLAVKAFATIGARRIGLPTAPAISRPVAVVPIGEGLQAFPSVSNLST